MQNTGEAIHESLTLLVCLDEKGEAEGTVYEDEGDGYGYLSGEYRLTHYRAKREDDDVKIEVVSTEGNWTKDERKVTAEVVG